MDDAVVDPSTVDEALHLNPDQMAAVHSNNLVLKGPYGSGKTSILESMIQRILMSGSNPKIVVVVREGMHLVERFKSRFPSIDVMD